MKVNKYGLPRYIPEDTKLKIRRQCGFGCVVCGMTIYEYEHVDPEFTEAKEHDPSKIALLCGSCHRKVTKKIWSKDKIIRARSNPKCLQQGYSNDFFDIDEPFGVSVGRIYFFKNETGDLIKIGNNTVLSLKIIKGEPPKLSGLFYDKNNDLIFEIKDNEWFGNPEVWDIESVGQTLTIKDNEKSILLQINARPPHIIAIEIANLNYGDISIYTNESTGRIFIKSRSRNYIDTTTGFIINGGPLEIHEDNLQLQNGAIVALGQDGIKMNPFDFDKFILTGQMISRSS